MKTRRDRQQQPEHGAALVVTLIVLVVLAAIAVAFMQNTGLDRSGSRSAANVYRARLAAEAGVAAGMGAIESAITKGRSGRDQWNYISGHLPQNPAIAESAINAEADSFAFIAQVDPATGKPGAPSFLVSSSPAASNVMIPLSSQSGEPSYPAQWVYLTTTDASGAQVNSARYAFWISDDTTKLNPSVMGTASSRGFSTDAANVRVTVRPDAGSRDSTTVVDSTTLTEFAGKITNSSFAHWDNTPDIRSRAPLLLTPGTFKLALGGAAPEQSLENDIALETLSSPIAPNGKPKVNLTRLKAYLDSLPKSQAGGNLRFEAVVDILDANKGETHKKWGGGDLSFLLDATVMGGKYTEKEARQLVANLFDALDEDFVPTCDDSVSPKILGTEIRKTAGGGVQGHPSIVYASAGHFAGKITQDETSRVRTHLVLGFANPWPTASEPWSKYTVDMTVTPSSPVFPTLTRANSDNLSSKPPAVTDSLPARSGYMFPCPSATSPHYSASLDISGKVPQVDDLKFTINSARLSYKSSDGTTVLVGVVPGSPVLEALPSTVVAGGDGVNRVAWQSGRQAYWLKSDPRLHVDASRWTILPNGAGGANTGVIPGPQSDINYMASTDEGDGAQGLTGTISPGMTSASPNHWYRSTSITNHLFVDGSLVFEGNKTTVASAGLLGFLSVGKPWQTLTLHNGNSNNPEDREDWKILDYVYSGEEIAAGNAALQANMAPKEPYGPEGERADWPGAFSRDGSLNALHGNWNSWRGLLEGIPGVNAGALATQLAEAGSQPYNSTFDFLRSVDLATGGTTDFERERPVRYIADALTTRSRSFTVYAVGEALVPTPVNQPVKVASRAMVKARLSIGLNESTGGVLLRSLGATSY